MPSLENWEWWFDVIMSSVEFGRLLEDFVPFSFTFVVTFMTIPTLGMHVQRGLRYLVCLCLCVC